MATVCFVTFEIHPTTLGGVGVLLHHAAAELLRRGHEVVFLLDMPRKQVRRFAEVDRLALPHPERCRVHDARALTADFPYPGEEIPSAAQRRAAAYGHAYLKLLEIEPELDAVEFIDYTGVGTYPMVQRLFGREPEGARRPVLGVRLHNPLELIDRFSPTSQMDRDRYALYGLERAGIAMAEAVLTPTMPYYEAYFRDSYRLEPRRVVESQSPKQPLPPPRDAPAAREHRVVFVGRMWHFKGVDQLVHAAVGLLRDRPGLDWSFEFIGPDSKESPFHASFTEYLLTLVPRSMRDRFVFTGNLSHEQIADRLATAGCAVFPNRFESFCYALHETYDAGVPVVVNDLPGFAAFFEHEKNCLVYDGTTEGLTAAMARMIDDGALRDRLRRPCAVATEPLGAFYDAPQASVPLVDRVEAETLDALVLVLCPSRLEQARPTLEALARQTHRAFRVVCLVGAEPDTEETIWLLGQPWHARGPDGRVLSGADLATAGCLSILRAGDRSEPGWLGACAGALARSSQIHAAGTWGVRGGALVSSQLDISPELWAQERGGELTRLVHRTAPGRLATDLLEMNLGPLGEIGWVLERCAAGTRVAVLPESMIALAAEPERGIEPGVLHYFAHRCLTPFGDRIAIASGLAHEREGELARRLAACEHRLRTLRVDPAGVYANGLPSEGLIVEHKLRLAHELGGRDLVKIAMRKLRGRITGKGVGDAESR